MMIPAPANIDAVIIWKPYTPSHFLHLTSSRERIHLLGRR